MTCRRQARIANEILMYFRSQKKSAGDLMLSDELDSDGEGGSLMLVDTLADDSEEVLDRLEREEMSTELLINIERVLDKREREIITLRYGLSGNVPLTQREIAEKRNISRSYVYRIAYCKRGYELRTPQGLYGL